MKNTNIILFIATAALLCSCGVYNRYKPQESVREDLYGENAISPTDGQTNFGTLEWRELFTDPCLQRLIDSALLRNADLRKAHLEVEAAKAMLTSARLSYLPSFALTPQGTSSYSDPVSSTTNSYTLPITASWEIDIFGKLTNQKREKRAQYEYTREYAQAVRSQVISTVANLYYTLITLDEQLYISIQNAKSWEEQTNMMKSLKEAGLTNEVGVAQTEAGWYKVLASVKDLEQQIKVTENALSLMLFDAPGKIERGDWKSTNLPDTFNVGIPLQLLSNRPDVRMAEYALEQAFYTTNGARSSFYPSITLKGSAGWTNLIGEVIMNPAEFVASAIASLTQPLFAQGKLTAQLKAAKARQEEAAINFEYSILSAGKEVNEALLNYQTANKKSSLLQKQVESLATAVTNTELMMKHGSLTYLDVIAAQQSYLNAQLTLSANKLQKAQSIISLYSALGGGSER